jgi:ATP-dependent RNA helicase DDX21
VYADFEVYGSSLGLAARAVYGGAPYGAQENKLRRGVDIAIGTQGRIKVI